MGHEIFFDIVEIYDVMIMWELFGDLWTNTNMGFFTILKGNEKGIYEIREWMTWGTWVEARWNLWF